MWRFSKIISHLTQTVFLYLFFKVSLWDVFFKHQQPHRCIFGVALSEKQSFFIWGPRQNGCSWFCVDVSMCLVGRLWDEVSPFRQGWMMMDQTQIWLEPGRDRQTVKSSRQICGAAPGNRWSSKMQEKSTVWVWLVDYGLAPLGFFFFWGPVSSFSTLCMCLYAVWWGYITAPKKENLSEPCLSTQTLTPPLFSSLLHSSLYK